MGKATKGISITFLIIIMVIIIVENLLLEPLLKRKQKTGFHPFLHDRRNASLLIIAHRGLLFFCFSHMFRNPKE